MDMSLRGNLHCQLPSEKSPFRATFVGVALDGDGLDGALDGVELNRGGLDGVALDGDALDDPAPLRF